MPSPPPDFAIVREETGPGVVRLILVGELDLATSFRLDCELREVEDGRPATVVVDLRGLELMDSPGLARLVAAHRRAVAGGWRLAIVAGGRPVETVLKTTRLGDYLDVVGDPADVLPQPLAG